MTWNLNADRPIYSQLVEKIQFQIVSGVYKPGDRLPSVRELAADANVNPNTMQKAFSELERSGLIITQRTSGRLVTDDSDKINSIKEKLALEQLKIFLNNIRELGLTPQEVLGLIDLNERSREEI